MDMKRQRNRCEAGPLPWSLLNTSQRDAIEAIAAALQEATDALTGQAERRRMAHEASATLDPLRSTQVVLLGGARGTGKTSVYASLLNETSARPYRPQAKTQEPEPPRELRDLGEHLIWLDPLDLEPLPGRTNLLVAVLVRIRAACERLLESPDVPFLGKPSEDPVVRLRRFTHEVAIAWEGNVEARAPHVDPDTYATESERTEMARVGLRLHLDERLEELTKEIRSRGGGSREKGMFVLPVDDFDLNPTRALDLLQLLRMVSVPRLFILVMGDWQLTEMVLNLRVTGDFAS